MKRNQRSEKKVKIRKVRDRTGQRGKRNPGKGIRRLGRGCTKL